VNVLFWDIDGTLIRTSKAGLYAFDQATVQLWEQSVDFSDIKAAGMTDHSIAAQIIQRLAGREPREEEIIALTDQYEQQLPANLAERKGWVLPSVLDILAHLQQRNDYKMLLLTGNSRTGAEIKLKHLGLANYFDFDKSAFCDRRSQRTEIAQYALATAEALYAGSKPLKVFVIGDTPNDIQCGQAIGAYTIAVATGSYSMSQLTAYSPWWAVEQLPHLAQFQEKIEAV